MKEKVKSISRDLILSIAGLVVMNGVIQFALYPYLCNQLGAEAWGEVLSMISLVAIMGSTFGTSANYSHMMCYTKKHNPKGDYNIFLAIVAVLSVLVSLVGVFWLGKVTPMFICGYIGFMFFSVLRYYSDVEFRMNGNFKKFFCYYLSISIGYVIGILSYQFTQSWLITMLSGEAFAFIYVLCFGKLYRNDLFKKSDFFKENMKSVALLSGTELITTVILNADRLFLQIIVGGAAVTIFYAATLVGKMTSLVSAPLNGVIISHLAKYDEKIKPVTFVKLCFSGIVVALVLDVLCVVASHIMVGLMYKNIFEQVVPLFGLANLGQIFFFVSNTLKVVLLRFIEEKYQLIINILYLIIFIALALPLTIIWELWGMAIALVIVNFIEIFIIMIIGYKELNKTI